MILCDLQLIRAKYYLIVSDYPHKVREINRRFNNDIMTAKTEYFQACTRLYELDDEISLCRLISYCNTPHLFAPVL